MPSTGPLDSAVRHHDAQVAALGLPIWVGAEPTYTDRLAQTPPWLNQAQGADKQPRAQALLRQLAGHFPGALLLRSRGRLYPGEDEARWSYGLLSQRDGTPLWRGPPEPLLLAPDHLPLAAPDVPAWAAALCTRLRAHAGCTCQARPAPSPHDPQAWCLSLVPPAAPPGSAALQILLGVQAIQSAAGPDAQACAVLHWPALDDVDLFLTLLACVEQASTACGLRALVLAGEPVPVDQRLALTTLTPDPAVIEVNTAPSSNASAFLQLARQIDRAALACQLAPYRLYFNGQVADSGGAGQITLGGPSPATSVFVSHAALLPGLVRYCNQHPALSYLFSHDFVGPGGQAVRADERGSDALDELRLALHLVEQQPQATAVQRCQSLIPFLCDVLGNRHRAEINIEKLANPELPGRGQLGLVEFRALRMQHSPERATAIACLLRALAAMLATQPHTAPLTSWGPALHQRYAMPFYLQADLDEVLADLQRAGLGLGAPIVDCLKQDECRFLAALDLPQGRLELWRALEFWPLLGDTSSAEQLGSARWVDASCSRIELRWRPPPPGPDPMVSSAARQAWDACEWHAGGLALPLRPERDAQGEVKVYSIRYRSFAPTRGLHPLLPAQAPLGLTLRAPGCSEGWRVQWHEWQPQGESYPGLPADLQDARQRRNERLTCEAITLTTPAVKAPERGAEVQGLCLGDYCLDLRFSL